MRECIDKNDEKIQRIHSVKKLIPEQKIRILYVRFRLFYFGSKYTQYLLALHTIVTKKDL